MDDIKSKFNVIISMYKKNNSERRWSQTFDITILTSSQNLIWFQKP